ncbi:MAG: bifunctional chorismate mutase/prephenate dehydratase [Clostridia bacterium]|jgi:chorismate mutase / prephenate dehydratase|nr:bifunctional chorismate mutase/prephenate dehydratase [Clostridia bacterium]
MGYDEQIKVLRERISDVDSQLVSLYEQRMKTIDDVAKLKQQFGKDVLDAKREDDVISRATSQLVDKNLSQATKEFFRAIMDISKKNQRKLLMDASPVKSRFAEIKNARVGYLGILGSYSHIATSESFDDSAVLKNYQSFDAILEGLKNDEVDYAMLPTENTQTGSVASAIDALARYGYYIVGEKMLPVAHCLLGVPGAKIEDIKKVYSHPQPIAQCSEFLGDKYEAYSSLSSAHAAKTVADMQEKSTACIASKHAGKIYGLQVLAHDIQNEDTNTTRFVVVAKQPYKGDDCSKTSIVIMLLHKPRALYEMLEVFSNVNILKLESRPIKDRQFEYQFHIDFEGCIYERDIAEMIERVKQQSAGYTYLGCYPKESV